MQMLVPLVLMVLTIVERPEVEPRKVEGQIQTETLRSQQASEEIEAKRAFDSILALARLDCYFAVAA